MSTSKHNWLCNMKGCVWEQHLLNQARLPATDYPRIQFARKHERVDRESGYSYLTWKFLYHKRLNLINNNTTHLPFFAFTRHPHLSTPSLLVFCHCLHTSFPNVVTFPLFKSKALLNIIKSDKDTEAKSETEQRREETEHAYVQTLLSFAPSLMHLC